MINCTCVKIFCGIYCFNQA